MRNWFRPKLTIREPQIGFAKTADLECIGIIWQESGSPDSAQKYTKVLSDSPKFEKIEQASNKRCYVSALVILRLCVRV